MTETNKDGLEPGQQVDFATLMRIERSRKNRVEEEARPEPKKPGRPRKQPPEQLDE